MPSVYFAIKSVNEALREVGGEITSQRQDKDGETLNYDESKPEFQGWSDEAYNATKHLGDGNESYGNLREQHSKRSVGKFNAPLKFDDSAKSIWGQAKIYDDDVWEKVKEGVYNGFSVGGNLKGPIKRVNGQKLITIIPREVSLVDNPAVGSAHFDFVRAADGQVVVKSFVGRSKLEVAADSLLDVFKAAEYTPAEIGQVLDHMKEHFAEELEEEQEGTEEASKVPPQDGAAVSQPVEALAYAPDAKLPDTASVPGTGAPDTQLGKKPTAEEQPGSNS